MPKPQSEESMLWDARARIMWGDSPSEVAESLTKQGVAQSRIGELISTCLAERAAAIRKRALIEILAGGAITLVLGGLLVSLYLDGLILNPKATGPMVLILCLGVHWLIDGIFKLIRGGKVRGSVGAPAEDSVL